MLLGNEGIYSLHKPYRIYPLFPAITPVHTLNPAPADAGRDQQSYACTCSSDLHTCEKLGGLGFRVQDSGFRA